MEMTAPIKLCRRHFTSEETSHAYKLEMKREGCEALLLFCTFARLAAGFWKEDGGMMPALGCNLLHNLSSREQMRC